MSKPTFSIVITTHNRAHLLPFAIDSVLQQSFSDFEIIISDNFSTDNTAQVAQSYEDKRINYFRTNELLPMAENYRYGLSKAKGEYITFLSDDDAFTADLLKKIKILLEENNSRMICWRFANYFPEGRISKDYAVFHPLRNIKPNSLLIPFFSSKIQEIESISTAKDILSDSLQKQETSLLNPVIKTALYTNAVFHSSVFQGIKKRGIDLFRKDVVLDVYGGTIFLSEVKKYLYLDEPLTVFCINELSATASFRKEKDSLARIFEDKSNKTRQLKTPIKSLFNRNYYYESLLQAKADIGREFENINLNLYSYYITCYDEILYLKKNGFNVEEELLAFESALSQESEELQSSVRSATKNSGRRNLIQFSNKVPRPAILIKLLSQINPRKIHNRGIIIDGKSVDVNNIKDFSTWLNTSRINELSKFCINMFEKKSAVLSYKWQIS